MQRVCIAVAALALMACGGSASRDSVEAAAGSSAVGGQSGGTVGAGGSSVQAGGGGRAGAGAAGVATVDAGPDPVDAGPDPDIVYRAVVTNGINSGDEVTFSRADATTNTCVFFSSFVGVGSAPEPVTMAFATPGADSCCPHDPDFAALCDTNGGCPSSNPVSGTIGGDPRSGFDVDLTIDFSDPRMWLPPVVQFRTSGLTYTNCD